MAAAADWWSADAGFVGRDIVAKIFALEGTELAYTALLEVIWQCRTKDSHQRRVQVVNADNLSEGMA